LLQNGKKLFFRLGEPAEGESRRSENSGDSTAISDRRFGQDIQQQGENRQVRRASKKL
jgi:hypothetical protein